MLRKVINLLSQFSLIFLITISNVIAEIVNKIEISGNQRIANETIKMFSDNPLGKNLNEEDLNIILKKLYNTNFFKNISVDLEKKYLR